jgi:outer membrane biosynthesis protein TonB
MELNTTTDPASGQGRRHSSVLQAPTLAEPRSALPMAALVIALLLATGGYGVYLLNTDEKTVAASPDAAVATPSVPMAVEPAPASPEQPPAEASPVVDTISLGAVVPAVEQPKAAQASTPAPVTSTPAKEKPPRPAKPQQPASQAAPAATPAPEPPRMTAAAAGKLGRQLAEARSALAAGNATSAQALAQAVLDQDPGNRQAQIVLRQAQALSR